LSEPASVRGDRASRLAATPAALAGGVILTTVTDIVGFAALLGLGALFLV